MKKLNIEQLLIGLVCIIVGMSLLGVALVNYFAFTSLPPLSATKETVEALKRLYVNCEFKFLPCVDIFLIFVGIKLLFNLRRRKLNSTRQP